MMAEKVQCVITYPNPVADDASTDSFSIIEDADLVEKRPVVVLLGWAGCKDKHLAKYSAIYEQKRYITVRYIGPTSALFFNHGRISGLSQGVLEALIENNLKDNPIFFHVFSNGGCYIYCNISKQIHTTDRYRTIPVKGCIFDSTPGKSRILKATKAFMATIRFNVIIKYLLGFCCFAFLLISYVLMIILQGKPKSKSAFLLFESVLNDEGRWPQMFLYSKADETIDYSDIEEVIEHRKQIGINVSSTCWDDSPHVAHYVKHKEIYTNLCLQFMQKCLD